MTDTSKLFSVSDMKGKCVSCGIPMPITRVCKDCLLKIKKPTPETKVFTGIEKKIQRLLKDTNFNQAAYY